MTENTIHDSYFIYYYQNVISLPTRRITKRHAASCIQANELPELRS